MSAALDVVVIGVNAAATLKACIGSVLAARRPAGGARVIYADGGSSDGSAALARGLGAEVVEVLAARPTPGLGRNAGWRHGEAPLVQFLDSDTRVDSGWLLRAAAFLADNPGYGAVFGNRAERRADASVYNWIASLEWNPQGQGDAGSFGGDVMIRREVLEATGGYDEVLVAGEDPDMGLRIRAAGWRIMHLDAAMTDHDMAMTRVGQWARRAFRTGYGYAAVSVRPHAGQDRWWRMECLRILVRGLLGQLLLVAGACAAFFHLAGVFMALAGLVLLLYPRLFSIGHFMRLHSLTLALARRYAWHCALVVAPQSWGMVRWAVGAMAGRPLRNRVARLATRAGGVAGLVLALALAGGCAQVDLRQSPDAPEQRFETEGQGPAQTQTFAPPEAIAAFDAQVPQEYLIGPGDTLDVSVWQRPEISDPGIIVAPDGGITVMRIGTVFAAGRTVEDVRAEIADRLGEFYVKPEVRLAVRKYMNNKAYVLGRVTSPGLVTFSGPGTLLEALSLAGGLPVVREEAFLTRCAIIRGRDRIIWIDLRELLQEGNLALNARVMNNDVVFIPESENELVYVMGQVGNPGAIRLKTRLTFMDAVMYAGGPTEDADLDQCYIIRFENGQGAVRRVSIRQLLEQADFSSNFVLQDNDVVYVAARGMADWNYVMRQLMPSMSVLDMGTNVLERFGVMPYAREQWWKGNLGTLKIQGD